MASRPVYNQRRRLERAAARARREGQDAYIVEELMQRAAALRGKVTAEKLEQARALSEIKTLSKETLKIRKPREKKGTKKESRSTRLQRIFKQDMNTAGEEASQFTELERDVFYAATRRIWAGKGDNPATRNERLLQHFYTSNTKDAKAFREWAAEEGFDMRKRDIFLVQEYVASRQSEAAYGEAEDVDGGTPRHLIKVTLMR